MMTLKNPLLDSPLLEQSLQSFVAEFPSFLPLSSLPLNQKLYGLLAPAHFQAMAILDLEFHQLLLSFKLLRSEAKGIKLFGETEAIFSRVCRKCWKSFQNVERIPLSCTLLPLIAARPSKQEKNLEPYFLRTEKGEKGLGVIEMVEHFLLRSMPTLYSHRACAG